MLGNNNNLHPRKYERFASSEHFVGDTYRSYYDHFNKTIERAMSTKLLIHLFNWIGIPAYLLSLLNVLGFTSFDNAKQFILFLLAVLFGVARLVVYCVENYQRLKYRSREEAKLKRWEQKSK